jgi:hypothetical protein
MHSRRPPCAGRYTGEADAAASDRRSARARSTRRSRRSCEPHLQGLDLWTVKCRTRHPDPIASLSTLPSTSAFMPSLH